MEAMMKSYGLESVKGADGQEENIQSKCWRQDMPIQSASDVLAIGQYRMEFMGNKS